MDPVDPWTLPRPRWPLSIMWWSPWTITRPWLPRWIRGSDEWHNRSWGLIVPPFGGLLVFRMRYARRDGTEHLWAWSKLDGWSGLKVLGCSICTEVQASFHEYHEYHDT
jgi:hypothetical protein